MLICLSDVHKDKMLKEAHKIKTKIIRYNN
jgi:hypothetical protein